MEALVTPGLHHAALVSGDLGRTRTFYRDLLGLQVLRDGPATDGFGLILGDPAGTPGTLLAFAHAPGAGRGNFGVGGVHHVALGTSDDDALLRWKRRLQDAGLNVSGPYDRRWFHSIYFRDPDGQVLEIATRGPGYTLDEPADALGRIEITPGAENLVGQRDEEAIRSRTWGEPVPEIAPGMALDGIHHVSGITDDVQRADGFLSAWLGLRLVKRTVNQDDPSSPHWFWARYDGQRVAPHSAYTLFGWPSSRRWARGGAGQAHHLAFRAASGDALRELRQRLEHEGVEVSPVQPQDGWESIHFSMPDGMLLEVATDPQRTSS